MINSSPPISCLTAFRSMCVCVDGGGRLYRLWQGGLCLNFLLEGEVPGDSYPQL